MNALLALAATLPQTLALTPSDDIWAYPHASDPEKDAYLRVWGLGGQAVGLEDASDFSYSLLQWDLTGLPAGKLKSAKLVLTSVADPKYTAEQTAKYPLEVRAAAAGFSEKQWRYDALAKHGPSADPKDRFGAGVAKFKAGEEFKIEVELNPDAFGAYLAAARAKNQLALALTTPMDVMLNEGVQTLYKVFSKDSPTVTTRPQLVLSFEK